ncbi:CD331 [Mytilus edulis]|uniref:FGFR1 n=1 Tax=Mytilus edulis TaxID=6550 RepID=A0A8S3QJR2_MYTED|nr:CD331 [Mytilus edulis]
MMITISCTMKFERNGRLFSKKDSVQVQIHDPPLLNLENFVMCNISSSVQITCSSNGHIKSFGDWEHSYSGKLIRYVPGKVSNNTSTISIVNCSLEDLGEYTCIAWNRIQNETYWSNVTTRLLVYGEDFFSLRTVVWILICLAVFLLTVTIATISFSRRSKFSNSTTSFAFHQFHIKSKFKTSVTKRYYAAPTSVYNISPYAATRLEYEEPLNIQQATLRRENEEIEEREEDNETNHYIEVL